MILPYYYIIETLRPIQRNGIISAMKTAIKPLYVFVLITVVVAVSYGNTLRAPFHFDDTNNIIYNDNIKSISNIPSFFYAPKGVTSQRPLLMATLAVDYQLSGLESTLSYHIFNIALHIVNAYLLYALIIRTSKRLGYAGENSTPTALLSALLFASHPVQTEAVTYIISRSMPMATMFYLIGLIVFIKAAEDKEHKLKWFLVMLLISIMGASSREDFATFPAVLLIFDYLFVSNRDFRSIFRHAHLYIAVLISIAYLAFLVATASYGANAGFGMKHITPVEYLMTQFNVHWTYLRLLILPINQNLDYDYPVAKTLLEMPTILSLVGHAGLWIAGIALFKKQPVLSFCILWFMITLTPSSSIVPLNDVIFEHRLYLPSIGFIAFLSIVIWRIVGGLKEKYSNAEKAIVIIMASLILTLSAASYSRNILWTNYVMLWSDTTAKSPNKSRAHFNLGHSYIVGGMFDKAETPLLRAIQIEPDYVDANYNLGLAYYSMKNNMANAAIYLEKTVSLKPSHINALIYLGNVYLELNRIDDAIGSYAKIIELRPSHLTFATLGNIYLYKKNMPDKAIEYYKKAIDMEPSYKGEIQIKIAEANRMKLQMLGFDNNTK